jgi:hypothetical protein
MNIDYYSSLSNLSASGLLSVTSPRYFSVVDSLL